MTVTSALPSQQHSYTRNYTSETHTKEIHIGLHTSLTKKSFANSLTSFLFVPRMVAATEEMTIRSKDDSNNELGRSTSLLISWSSVVLQPRVPIYNPAHKRITPPLVTPTEPRPQRNESRTGK